MRWVDALGYFAALLVLATFSMKTMLPLRITGIASNCVFIAYGYFASALPVVVLHLILLPLNSLRLYQMWQLVKRVQDASSGNQSMDWLKPYMTRRRYRLGDLVFRKDDTADQMFYTMTGRFRLVEIETEVGPGQVIGELGFLSPENRRTLTFKCVEDGELLAISYLDLRQLYFQNPTFGLYFLRLTSERLFRDIRRLEGAQARQAN
jgi:hypothetical protein